MKAARAAGIGILLLLGASLAINTTWIARHLAILRPVAGGTAAPPFSLPLYGGGEFQMQPGHVTVIDFWAEWCGPCRAEMPTLSALDQRYRDHGVDFVSVNVEGEETRPRVNAYLERARLAQRVALGGGEVAEQYRVENLPHVVVVDGAGKIRNVLIGESSEAELVAAIEAAR